MSAGESGLEKRGHLTSLDTGKKDLWVLRKGVLRIYEAAQKNQRSLIGSVMLAYRCEVRSQPNGVLEIHSHLPYDCEYAYRADSPAEAESWRTALQTSLSECSKRMQKYLQFLQEGCVAYKYNYSNSKRMRRHFWINEANVELCWGKSRSEEPQTMELKDCVGIIYGPMTTTFQRTNALEDPPWSCFSLLFPDRTLDLAVTGDHIDKWFLGLQDLLLARCTACMSTLSEPSFAFRKVFHKIRDSAHRQNFTTRALITRQLRTLGGDKGFREAMKNQSLNGSSAKNGSSVDAEKAEKEERRRRRKEKEGKALEVSTDAETSRSKRGDPEASPAVSPSPLLKTMKAWSGTNDACEEELNHMISKLEKELDAQTSKLEALRPRWTASLGSVLPMDGLQEVLRADCKWEWQAEKCTELEREVLMLKCASSSAQTQLQVTEKAEKQLRKLAKQFQEGEAKCQDMEKELGSAQASETGAENEKLSSKADLERAEAQVKQLEARAKELTQQLQEAERGNQELEKMFKTKNKAQEEELAKVDRKKEDLKLKEEGLAKDVKSLEKKNQENKQRLASTENLSQNLVTAMTKLKKEVARLRDENKQVREEWDTQVRYISDRFPVLKGRLETMMSEIDHLEVKHREICEERKRLNNLVLELKGNIRVMVRVRPMSDKEKEQESSKEATITFAEETKVSVFSEEQTRRKWFDFDYCFQPKLSNAKVFEEIKALAVSVLDGYNVCIFAYGQTGSGKTYTMAGTDGDPGMNARTLKELFRLKDERKLDVDTRMTIMVTEVYNEMIKDLLGGKETLQKKLDVKVAADNTTSVPGLTEIEVHSVEEVLKCMADAQANRTVMQTDMNDESSRSHSIVQVKTTCYHKKDKKEFIGKINLIDLAGSENTNKSGVTGQGMKEAQNINKSLSALGDVVAALIQKSSHVPYRNSKLTMMLKDSLGGDSKTLMIVQCSPAQCNVTETLSSLNFASRTRNVELGKAKKNVKSDDK